MPRGAVIVAHPDDESLWCGGWLLQHPGWDWLVVTLCRRSDEDRARRFASVMSYLGSVGSMADLDDGPSQVPLAPELVRRTIEEALPVRDYDVVLTHGPRGEYTRHVRHEECSRAVAELWAGGRIHTREMKFFAYGDHGGSTLPVASVNADERITLSAELVARKYHIITKLYGFEENSWEARASPNPEAFSVARSPSSLSQLAQLRAESGIQ